MNASSSPSVINYLPTQNLSLLRIEEDRPEDFRVNALGNLHAEQEQANAVGGRSQRQAAGQEEYYVGGAIMVLQHQQTPQQQQQSVESGDGGGGGSVSHISMSMGSGSAMASSSSSSSSSSGGNGGGGGALNAPRLHPKKRKYDPSEAEHYATDLSAVQQQQPQQPQQEVHESEGGGGGEGGETVKQEEMDTQQQQQQSHDIRTQPELDLRDWCETRVLAKYKKGESVYVQGVIKSSDNAAQLVVEFEGPDGAGLRQTYDVINSNRFDIIADASPSISDVSVCCGQWVCDVKSGS